MEQETVARLRSFHRAVTGRVGALETEYLGRARPLGESRVLWEIGPRGIEVRDLRRRLGLDSGYVSRLLRSLEAQGLAVVEESAADAGACRAAHGARAARARGARQAVRRARAVDPRAARRGPADVARRGGAGRGG